MCSLALNIMREAGWVEMVWVGLSDDNNFHFIFRLFGFAISGFRRFPEENWQKWQNVTPVTMWIPNSNHSLERGVWLPSLMPRCSGRHGGMVKVSAARDERSSFAVFELDVMWWWYDVLVLQQEWFNSKFIIVPKKNDVVLEKIQFSMNPINMLEKQTPRNINSFLTSIPESIPSRRPAEQSRSPEKKRAAFWGFGTKSWFFWD